MNVLNDLAKAKRRWTKKNLFLRSLGFAFVGLSRSALHLLPLPWLEVRPDVFRLNMGKLKLCGKVITDHYELVMHLIEWMSKCRVCFKGRKSALGATAAHVCLFHSCMPLRKKRCCDDASTWSVRMSHVIDAWCCRVIWMLFQVSLLHVSMRNCYMCEMCVTCLMWKRACTSIHSGRCALWQCATEKLWCAFSSTWVDHSNVLDVGMFDKNFQSGCHPHGFYFAWSRRKDAGETVPNGCR